MIISEKIMSLRKQYGWSQEELADLVGVSRQSVSKWESAASMPDIQKIIKLSEVFGVSVDYLLKDEMDLPESSKVASTTDIGADNDNRLKKPMIIWLIQKSMRQELPVLCRCLFYLRYQTS